MGRKRGVRNGADVIESAAQFTEIYKEQIPNGIAIQSRCRLLSFLHTLPPSITFPTINTDEISWETILYEESVPLSLNSTTNDPPKRSSSSSSFNSTEVASLSSEQINQNWFLNVGAPVWALDASSPYNNSRDTSTSIERPQKRKKLEKPSDDFVVLAIGLSPWDRPISLAQSDPVYDPSVIQLWRISSNPNKPPRLALGLLHNGRFCRSLSWARHSGGNGTIGLLFAVLGDGSLNCFSIPAAPFLIDDDSNTSLNNAPTTLFKLIPPIWHLSPSMFGNVQFTCIAPAPFFSHPQIVYSEDPDVDSASLQVAAGSKDGRVFIWRITNSTSSFDSPSIYQLFDRNSITSMAWSPEPHLQMLAVCSSEGKVRIWDLRSLLDGFLFDLDNVKRPCYQIHWPPMSRFLFVSHLGGGYVYNSVKQEGAHCNGQGGEIPSWSCTSYGALSLFAFDDGRLLMYPVNRLEKKSNAYTTAVCWNYNENEESSEEIPEKKAASLRAPHEAQGELGPVLNTFYSEVTKFYAAGSMKRRQGINIRIGNDRTMKKLKKKTPLKDVLDNLMSNSRLHSVTALDPLIYSSFAWPFVACGGDSGIVHLFNPQTSLNQNE